MKSRPLYTAATSMTGLRGGTGRSIITAAVAGAREVAGGDPGNLPLTRGPPIATVQPAAPPDSGHAEVVRPTRTNARAHVWRAAAAGRALCRPPPALSIQAWRARGAFSRWFRSFVLYELFLRSYGRKSAQTCSAIRYR